MCDLNALIGQTIVVGIRGAETSMDEMRVDLEICKHAQVGGVILFDRDLATGTDRNIQSPAQVSELTSCLRETLGDDLLIMIDQEGGGVARLGAKHGFDPGISASEFACLEEEQQHEIAHTQAIQLSGIGINVNLAPVADLAIADQSEVITRLGRSFGIDPYRIVRCAQVWIQEHLDAGVITCLKHFPGHGSVAGDTHAGLVDLSGRASREQELKPYNKLVNEPGMMVMTGHLLENSIDPDLPASLSRSHTTGVLRDEIGFDGVVLTDSIDMGAIASRWAAGEAAVLAINAGADLVMDGVNSMGDRRGCPAELMSGAINAAISSGLIRDGVARLKASAARLDHLRDVVRAE